MTPGLRSMGDKLYTLDELEVGTPCQHNPCHAWPAAEARAELCPSLLCTCMRSDPMHPPPPPPPHLQGKLEELEAEIMEVNGNSERLARSYNELVELQLVLERAGSFFDQVRLGHHHRRLRTFASLFQQRRASRNSAKASAAVSRRTSAAVPG